ncbi:hypothetical protein D3C78_1659010 [compost metagenome]
MHLLLAVAHHDHRLLADIRGLVAAGLGEFAGVGDPHPGALEDLLQFFVEDLRVGVQRGVHAIVQRQVRVVRGRHFRIGRDDLIVGVHPRFLIYGALAPAKSKKGKSAYR